jgi:hypothetical protein
MATTTRARRERIEFRTTPQVRRLVERSVEASGSNLTAPARRTSDNLVLMLKDIKRTLRRNPR